VEVEYYSHLLLSLVNQSILFDYATVYYYNHKEIASPSEYKLTDDEYNDFLGWVENQDFDMDGALDELIIGLEKTAKEEKYYEGISSELTTLKLAIEGVKKTYLTAYKKEIKTLLEEEIISRYYLYTGSLEASLNYDPTVIKAIDVLQDKNKYNKLLNK